ncbi:unnamed protein product, partial [Bubo scandiacus]
QMSKMCLNLPTDTFLCEAEKGKNVLSIQRIKNDGHSMFKPLKQDSVKHVAVSIATGVKSKGILLVPLQKIASP